MGNGLANSGTLRGNGVVDSSVFNDGDLRCSYGERLMLSGLTNSGEVRVFGGELEVIFPAENRPAGEINCRDALLQFDSGLTNEGELAFSFGTSDVFGPVDNIGPDGRIIVSGRSDATFWDDVVNGTDAEFKISEDSTVIFFGDVSGAGNYTGSGTARYESSFSPGASPASVSIGGDIVLESGSTLVMELGGTVPGSEHDRLQIAGALDLRGGTLEVPLIDGFVPAPGDRFDLFDFGSIIGTFGAIDLPALASGQFWNTSQLYSTGEIFVACVPETYAEWQAAYFFPGEADGFMDDFDRDGVANGIEFLFASHPRSAGPAPTTVSASAGVDTRLVLEFTLPEPLGADSVLEVEANAGLAPGAWITIATKTGAAPWTGGASVSVTPIGGGKVWVEVADIARIADGPRRFIRLRGAISP